MRAFRHRDFRIFWSGAFLSFVGSWIQNVAQGWLVYDLTADKTKLALVNFCSSLPVAFLALFAGIIADTFDKRRTLILCQAIFGLGALYLAAATAFGFVDYWQILIVATLGGIVGAIETPMRQSSISRLVPAQDLPSAIPLQALTFNMGRIVGPALGGVLLAALGPSLCYLLNGLSFMALIFAVLSIRADLSAEPRQAQPVLSMIRDGVRTMWQDRRLQTLFLMECVLSFFGLAYVAFIPAIAVEHLRLDERGLGLMYTCVGLGAVSALLFISSLKTNLQRATGILVAMPTLAVTLFFFSATREPKVAYGLLILAGLCTVMQFNSTNTLFQMMAPEGMRGRLLSLHIWALSGVGPFGSLIAGPLATRYGLTPVLQVGAGVILVVGLLAWARRGAFRSLEEVRAAT